MEATLLSTLLLLVEELPVKTGEDLHGFALPVSDPLYGTFERSSRRYGSDFAPIRVHISPRTA
jgi:hypothetical protein